MNDCPKLDKVDSCPYSKKCNIACLYNANQELLEVHCEKVQKLLMWIAYGFFAASICCMIVVVSFLFT